MLYVRDLQLGFRGTLGFSGTLTGVPQVITICSTKTQGKYTNQDA